jgi:hypothetical protein
MFPIMPRSTLWPKLSVKGTGLRPAPYIERWLDMMMRRQKLAALMIAPMVFALSSGDAPASCAPGIGPIRDRLSQFSAVFVGRVTAVHGGGPSAPKGTEPECGTPVSFAVSKAWKGVHASAISLPNHFVLGAPFEVGAEYLVVAQRMAGCPIVCVGCGETRRVEKAGDEIRLLGKPKFRSRKVDERANALVQPITAPAESASDAPNCPAR